MPARKGSKVFSKTTITLYTIIIKSMLLENEFWNSTLPNVWEVIEGFQRQKACAGVMLREDSLATNVANTDESKERNQQQRVYREDLKRMVQNYNNVPITVYCNNIVRFFKDV